MDNNIIINDLKAKGYFVAIIDGKNCRNKINFLKDIGKAFEFPDYYGQNLNALDECINDLEWVQSSNYALVILNSKDLLSKETPEWKLRIFGVIENAVYEWEKVSDKTNLEKKLILK